MLPGTCSEDPQTANEPLALLSSMTQRGFRATVVPIDESDTPLVTKECREALGVAALLAVPLVELRVPAGKTLISSSCKWLD